MSKVFISDINLSNIADAIRAKNGAQTQYYPREMAAAITALDVEEHKPIQVNIQQSEHQTIKVKVKQKELNNTTINANVELPETIQLEATVTADEGYTPGTLNQSLVNAEWGDTVTFNVTEATFEKYETVLSSQDISIREGKNAVITVNITPSDAFGTVEAIDSDTNQILKTESINNSKARIVISGLTRGKHRIILNYIGNDMYLPSSTYSLVTVTASIS